VIVRSLPLLLNPPGRRTPELAHFARIPRTVELPRMSFIVMQL